MALVTFDLPAVFRCAAELAEASASYRPEEYTDILTRSPSSAEDEDRDTIRRWHDALDTIGMASNRVKRALGATGPLDAAELLHHPDTPPTWEDFRSRFRYSVHPPTVRHALYKLACAAIDLSGYASMQAPEPLFRERGLRLLRQGVAQLWQGMTNTQRAEVGSLLPLIHAALGWPADPAAEPAAYDGPEEISDADQYRIIDLTGGFTTRTREFLDEQQRLLSAEYKRASFAQGGVPAMHEVVERINPLHQLAVRCLNVVLRLHQLRYCLDGVKHGSAALIELCGAVATLPPLPLADDPFCREEVIDVAGVKATSAHAVAFLLAQQTWDAVQRSSLGPATGSWRGEEEGAAYTRTTFSVRRQAPTEVPWSDDVWQEICKALNNYPVPDADWFQAALALEQNRVARRVRDHAESGRQEPVSKTGRKRQEPLRSWTQTDLDDAIREYKAKRADRYNDLVEGVRQGKPGAKKAAQQLGRRLCSW